MNHVLLLSYPANTKCNKCQKKTEEKIKNVEYKDTGNIGYDTQIDDSRKKSISGNLTRTIRRVFQSNIIDPFDSCEIICSSLRSLEHRNNLKLSCRTEKTTDLSQVTDKLYHIMLYTSPWSRFELTTSVVIGTDCIGSCYFIKLLPYCHYSIWHLSVIRQ
jgi:hypothetical protein